MTVLVATWGDGVFVVSGESSHHELGGEPVGSLVGDGRGGAIATIGRALCRRSADGEWSTIATSEFDLACACVVGDITYVGTHDARVLCIDADGRVERLHGFDDVPGREAWYAGSATIEGRVVGPPLGVRSLTATADQAVLLANVHVGGIPRSTDGGATWRPTIDIDSDVHEVRAHPTDPGLVVAAAAHGLCISRDRGATWTIESDGLHAGYCSAVAFSGRDILVSGSSDHFATDGAVYRRPGDGAAPPVPVGDGLPARLDGIVDTACIAVRGSTLAVADKAGSLYMSAGGGGWSRRAGGLPSPSAVLLA